MLRKRESYSSVQDGERKVIVAFLFKANLNAITFSRSNVLLRLIVYTALGEFVKHKHIPFTI